jgi:O-antigen/teichoic acid export membrane protein
MAKKRLARYISNVILVLFISFSILGFLVFLFNQYIQARFGLPVEWQFASVLVAFSQFITLINLTLWVIEKKPVHYGVYQTSQTLLFASLSLFTVIALEMNWIGYLTGLVLAAISFGLISIFFLYKRGYFNLNVRKLYIKDFLMFGIPMVPHQLGDWFRTQGDKLLIVTFVGTAATGIFSVGQQLALVMLILITSLNKALYPSLYQILSYQPDINRKNQVVKRSYQIALGMIGIGLIGFILTPVFYPYLLGHNFQSASLVTQLIIIAMIFESFYYLVVNYIFYTKKTKVLAKITFSVAVFHIALSYVLIGLMGLDYQAIAYSMILSSFLQFVLVWWFSNRVYPMPWFTFYKKEL